MRKLVTNRWVHVHPGIVSRGVMEEATRVTICVQHFAFLLLVDDNIFVFNKY